MTERHQAIYNTYKRKMITCTDQILHLQELIHFLVNLKDLERTTEFLLFMQCCKLFYQVMVLILEAVLHVLYF